MGRVGRQILAVLLSGLIPTIGFANPTGGVVHSGSATISGEGTGTVTINQASSSALLSWQKFNIAQGETTNFVQPSARAIALNRILDGQASSILGNLNANGRVYLINPNGILFGQSAVVNVGGLAAATQAQVTGMVNADLDALASAQQAPGARITNQGQINVAPGGDVYLVGAQVENSATGAIHVENGTVKVASGATLELAGEDGISVQYQAPTTPDNTAVNLGQIIANKGIVDIRASVVRQAGTVQASAAVEREGQIVLVGDSEVHVDGETATQNGDISATSGGDVVIGAGGALRSQTGDVDVTAGRDVKFTSTDQFRDSVIETGSGNIQVVAERDVDLQPDANLAGNTAIRTRGIDDSSSGHVQHVKGDGGNVTVVARTGNVNSGSADRWVDSAPPVDPTFFELFGVPYPTGYDPTPVDPRGILGIGSEAGGNVTVIAGGGVSTRRADNVLGRSGGSATASPDPSNPGAALPMDYDGSHIGVFGQGYETFLIPAGFGTVDSVTIPLANSPRAKLTVVAGGDISGDYMIRNGEAKLRAGYSLDSGALDRVIADPSALAAIEASADPGAQGLSRSAAAEADPARGWLGSLGSPLTLDMVRASADGRGANGVALRAAENPTLVYPSANGDAGGTAKAPFYDETDSLSLDAERGDVVLLGSDDVIRERGVGVDQRNPFVTVLPPNVSITTHDFTRGAESRGGDLVLLTDFTMLPSQQGGLSLDVAGKVRTAGVAASGHSGVQLRILSNGTAGDSSFTLPGGLTLRDPVTGAEFQLDAPVSMLPRSVQVPASGVVSFNLSAGAQANGVTIPAGTTLLTNTGAKFVTDTLLVVPPAAERQRVTQVTFTLDHPASGVTVIGQNQATFVGPDGAVYRPSGDVKIGLGRSSVTFTVTAQTGGGPDLRVGQLALQTPISGVVSATNTSASTRPTATTVNAHSLLPGSEGNVLGHEISGIETPIPGVVSVTNAGIILGKDTGPTGTAAGSGQVLPLATATNVIGPAGVPPNGRVLEIAPGQTLPPGISASDLEITSLDRAPSRTDAFVPAVFRTLQVTRDDTGKVLSTQLDARPSEVAVFGPSEIWVASQPPLVPTAHLLQSKASPTLDERGTNVFDYAGYYRSCRSGAACEGFDRIDPVTQLPVIRGSKPTHTKNPSPAILLAGGGFHRIGIDLAEAATVWSGGDVVDLQLRTEHTEATDLTQIVVPTGNVRLGSENETVVDNQLGVPIELTLTADAGSGMLVSGPGHARLLVGVAPHSQPIQGFDGELAALVPAPVDPDNTGIVLASWKGSEESFTGLDERGLTAPAKGDGKLFANEAPWVPTGEGGELELNDVGGDQSLGLLTSGNGSNPTLPRGGATLDVITAGNIEVHRFGAVGTIQGGDLFVQSVAGSIHAEQPPTTYSRQRGFFTINATVVGAGAEAEETGGGKLFLDASGDVNSGGSAVATLSSSDIFIETRTGSITAGQGRTFGAPTVAFDAVTGTPTVNYTGAGFFAAGTGLIHLKARKDINLGAGIRARGITLTAGGNVTAGTGAAQAQNIQIDAGGSISGSFSATSISIGSGTLSSTASVSAGVVSGAGSSVSNTGANQVSASGVVAGTSAAATTVSENAEGTANAGLRSVVIDVTSRPCDTDDDDCR